jgi:predicted aspartyl protease
MAMTPRLESERFPYLPLQLVVRDQTYVIEALIDTGFDGDVAVPPEALADGEPPDDYQRWILADGSQVVAAFYIGAVTLGGAVSFAAAITALGDEAIIGRGVIDRIRLILDRGERVIVEP